MNYIHLHSCHPPVHTPILHHWQCNNVTCQRQTNGTRTSSAEHGSVTSLFTFLLVPSRPGSWQLFVLWLERVIFWMYSHFPNNKLVCKLFIVPRPKTLFTRIILVFPSSQWTLRKYHWLLIVITITIEDKNVFLLSTHVYRIEVTSYKMHKNKAFLHTNKDTCLPCDFFGISYFYYFTSLFSYRKM